jgi:nitrogen regulatory protein P-II 1
MVVEDAVADSVVTVLVKSAGTGKIGDGKVWITDVSRVVRIRTGEEGRDAV